MRIQYCSDLHLEFADNKFLIKRFPLIPDADILILAGDIASLEKIEEQADFFDFVSENFEFVYWIPGNHEYYYGDLANFENPLLRKIRQNVFLLNNKTINYKGVSLIFSTLWSHIPPVAEIKVHRSLSDFHVIIKNGDGLKITDYNLLHSQSLAFIKTELALPSKGKRIVVTHHVPTFMNYPDKYKNSLINSAFATELYELIEDSQAACWIYGHSHANISAYKIGKTMLLTNQLGYVHHKEHFTFNRSAVFEILPQTNDLKAEEVID